MYAEIDTLIWYTKQNKRSSNHCFEAFESSRFDELFFLRVSFFVAVDFYWSLKMVLPQTGKTRAKTCTAKSNLFLRSPQLFTHSQASALWASHRGSEASRIKVGSSRQCEQFYHFFSQRRFGDKYRNGFPYRICIAVYWFISDYIVPVERQFFFYISIFGFLVTFLLLSLRLSLSHCHHTSGFNLL